MLTGVVCYIERAHGGNALRRIRLVGPELDQAWVAPGSGDDTPRPPAPGEQLAHLRSAAAWIAEEISPVRELTAICLDTEGGVCSWVSAPSADDDVVLAAIRQAAPQPAAGASESATPPGGFGLLPDDAMGMGGGRSIQALAAREPATRTSLIPGARAAVAVGPRKRLGVLSVADAPVRVLLDELDRLKISVGAVLTFWHAAALAWDPAVASRSSRRSRAEKNGTAPDARDPIVIEADAPVTAAVVVDPAGRLTWAWARHGELLAAGAMRLRTHTFARTPAAAAPEPFGGESDLVDLAAARRVTADEPGETIRAAECSSGDVGRLVMDWLSWSVQIGRTPDRVVCIGPPTISHRPNADEPAPTPASIAQALAAAWPGAAVDAAVHDDPIGATLNRLRTLPMFAPTGAKSAEPGALEEDPRLNVVNLTTRAGRLDRTMYVWTTVAILGAAAAVFIYSRRLGSGIEDLRTRAAAVQAKRTELLQSAEHIIPVLSKSPDPIGMLSSKIQEYSDELNRVGKPNRYLDGILPALNILKDPVAYPDIEITSIGGSTLRLVIEFTVPVDNDSPVQIRSELDKSYGPGVWEGTWGSTTRDRRTYILSSNTLGGVK